MTLQRYWMVWATAQQANEDAREALDDLASSLEELSQHYSANSPLTVDYDVHFQGRS